MFGTNYRETVSVTDVGAFNSGLDTADGVSLLGGTLMTIDGTKNMAAGGLVMASGVTATASSGGLAIAISGSTVVAGAGVAALGALEAYTGSVLASNAVNNFSNRRSESSSSSSSSNSSSQKTGDKPYTPDRKIKNDPRTGNPVVDSEAKGRTHTQ